MGRIQPTRASAWTARRRSARIGRVRGVSRHFTAGHWRVLVKQRGRQHEMWYPSSADGLRRAEQQRRIAEALR